MTQLTRCVRTPIVLVLALALWNLQGSWGFASEPGAPERDRYLLLDSRIIEETENVHLTVGTVQKDKSNRSRV